MQTNSPPFEQFTMLDNPKASFTSEFIVFFFKPRIILSFYED